MRAMFSIVGLLLVLAIVGLLAKGQFGAASKPIVAPSGSPDVTVPVTTPGATAQQQSQQIQQQLKQSVEAAVQSPRVVPEPQRHGLQDKVGYVV